MGFWRAPWTRGAESNANGRFVPHWDSPNADKGLVFDIEEARAHDCCGLRACFGTKSTPIWCVIHGSPSPTPCSSSPNALNTG
jgi:hypothetical protein